MSLQKTITNIVVCSALIVSQQALAATYTLPASSNPGSISLDNVLLTGGGITADA